MSNFCKYHPLEAATYFCSRCQTYTCDDCTNDNQHSEEGFCFKCLQEAQFLGSASSEEPFWRRLDQSFRYPLNVSAAVLIVGISILNSVVLYLPFAILWQLMLEGALMSYCFACLKQTAVGKFKAPSITAAYEGGLLLLAKLFVIFMIMAIFVGLIFYLLGPLVGNVAAVIAIASIPAAIILFGFSDSLIEALNPVKQFRLIAAVGLPYGLFLAFILVMTVSVGIISELIGSRFTEVSTMLQATVANYYTVVLFQMMGYMIFQYQGELGFTARADQGKGKKLRDDAERAKLFIDILAKEGEFKLLLKKLRTDAKKFPDDPYFAKQYFEFILAIRNTEIIDEVGSFYLGYLIKHQEIHLLNLAYKRILQVKPDFKAATADIRHRLAHVLRQSGDPKTAVKVLNHLHKEFPDYAKLSAAYVLMAECLEELPDMEQHAGQYRQLASKLGEQQKGKQVQLKAQEGSAGPLQSADQPPSISSIVDKRVVDSLTLVPMEGESQVEEQEEDDVF